MSNWRRTCSTPLVLTKRSAIKQRQAFVSWNELSNESSPEIGRQMASVLLKNALDAKDSRVKVNSGDRCDLDPTLYLDNVTL